MEFANPEASYLLFLPIMPLLIHFFGERSRRRALLAFADPHLQPHLVAGRAAPRRLAGAILISLSLLFSVIALMRPLWGTEDGKELQRGLDLIIAIDVSRSMLAEDVKPGRLALARIAVANLVASLQEDRVGLIAFAGSSFVVCPLTTDHNAFMLALDDLDTASIPKGGTSLAAPIQEAVKVFHPGDRAGRVMLLLSDGEDHGSAWREAADAARREGIRIFAVGVGTQAGELIPLADDKGERGFLKDQKGNLVRSRLDDAPLREIGALAGGGYLALAGSPVALSRLYETRLAELEKKEIAPSGRHRLKERFQIPLALALIFLMADPVIRFAGQRK